MVGLFAKSGKFSSSQSALPWSYELVQFESVEGPSHNGESI